MKKQYLKPDIASLEVELEQGIATSSCKGAHQGQGHGNGKGCKADDLYNIDNSTSEYTSPFD